jgi:hypothetical protein
VYCTTNCCQSHTQNMPPSFTGIAQAARADACSLLWLLTCLRLLPALRKQKAARGNACP